ncbi:MAG: hypothetical protein FD180_3441 [Planctomycetota bacterium]|nr:MAG: hypothetical protein FD180_3441 [Planctomycetota bacterium]
MFAVITLSLFAAPLRAQTPPKPEPPTREAEFKKQIASSWEQLAMWCVKWKFRAEARAAADEALALDAANVKAKSALEWAEKEGPQTNEALRKDYEKKLDATKKQASGLWRQIAQDPLVAKDAAAGDAAWGRALELDPTTIQPLHEAEVRAAMKKEDWKRAARLLAQEEAALGSDAARAKTMREVEAKSSVTDPLLRKASTHELRYFLSLPPGWTPDKTWPVLVVCEGAGGNYRDQCARFASYRKDVPVIVMAPCTFTNSGGPRKDKHPWYSAEVIAEWTNKNTLDFDEAGMLAGLADLRREYGAEEKFFIAGYSGGGILTWWTIFRRPAELRGAFPACANYGGSPPTPPEGGRDLVIRAFQGDKDGHLEMLTESWKRAEEQLKKWEYTDFSRTLLPGVGHTACHEPIYKAIQEILKK